MNGSYLIRRFIWTIPVMVILTATGTFFEVWARGEGPSFTVYAAVVCIPVHVFGLNPLAMKFPVLSLLLRDWAVTVIAQFLYALFLIAVAQRLINKHRH